MTDTHLLYRTEYTKTGKLSLHNRKPYRTKAQKAEARRLAYRAKDGTWRSNAPFSCHPAPRG